MPFTIDLAGKRALVTGAGQGVGRAIARSLSQAGAAVAVNDVVPDRADAVATEIAGAGGKAEAAPFDVSDWPAVQGAVERHGPFDILVNNAGNAGVESITMGPFVDTDPAEWERYLKVNLYGVMYCTRAVLPAMVDHLDGRVITIVSDAARWGDAHLAPYAAAKAGAAGLTRSVAREVGRYGITANNIALGTIRGPSSGAESDDAESDERLEKRLRQYIIRRRGEPDDIAGMVVYLASPLASWITGQTYPVNGGYTLAL